MSSSICPHCHTSVPLGASVCTGCQAEVEYGTPSGATVLVLIIAGFVGYSAGHASYSAVGWLIFAALAGGGMYACSNLFKNRINFKRVYRTRR